jgi:RNA polymerase sigma-70 factor (ECF subfamily)
VAVARLEEDNRRYRAVRVTQGVARVVGQSRAEEAFVRLADLELDRSYRLAGLILGNQAEAEDATQDALERAWAGYGGLRDPAGFQAWFDRILVNVCRDRLRRRKIVRFMPLGDEHEQRAGRDPFADLLASDELLRAMRKLDPDLRTVVVLRYWADLPIDEIARRCGWRSGTVKSRLHRAIDHMRRHLADAEREAARVSAAAATAAPIATRPEDQS